MRLARAYAGLTQTELGKRIGATQSYVSLLESGEKPIAPLLDALIDATGLPGGFFDKNIHWEQPEGAVSFRKRSGCPAGISDRAYFYSQTAHAIAQPLVAGFIKYPQPLIPSIPTSHCATPYEARMAGAEAAKSLRSTWGIGWGPISNVIRLLESKGVRFFYVRESVEQLDGFACWTAGKPYIFLNQKLEDPARETLNAAHELGHLVMHRDVALDSQTDFYESMAFGFAAEFLAPWETFKKEAPVIPDLNQLGRLKVRWRISMQAMVKHMHANGAISDAAYQNAFRKFSILGYRRGPEPGWLIPDHSVIHTKFVEIVQEKGLSISNLAEKAGMSDRLLGDMIPATATVDFSF